MYEELFELNRKLEIAANTEMQKVNIEIEMFTIIRDMNDDALIGLIDEIDVRHNLPSVLFELTCNEIGERFGVKS